MLNRLKTLLIKQLMPSGYSLYPVGYNAGWWQSLIQEPFTGAWQRNMELRAETPLAYSAVFACISLISGDISKLRIKLVEQRENDVWVEVESAAFSPVLRKPNHYQTRISFLESWVASKLMRGNTYVFKERDDRRIVIALHVLDPTRVKPLVAPNGDVFYQINRDDLAGVEEDIVIPASEIIHDRMNCFYHPLCGLSPLYACIIPIAQGLSIQRNSWQFFENMSRPSGILTAPGTINDVTAKRIADQWHEATTGKNIGKIIVAGDDLKFNPMGISAEDAKLVDQAKLTAETVCSAFHVPPYMVGLGAPPTYNNVEALTTLYYTQCLQVLIEALELSLDEGLGLPSVTGRTLGTELDLDGLLRLDTPTLYSTLNTAVGGGWLAPNEARSRANYLGARGGESPMMQQQVFSLEALANRDAIAPAPPAPVPAPDQTDEEDEDLDSAAFAQSADWELRRFLSL